MHENSTSTFATHGFRPSQTELQDLYIMQTTMLAPYLYCFMPCIVKRRHVARIVSQFNRPIQYFRFLVAMEYLPFFYRLQVFIIFW